MAGEISRGQAMAMQAALAKIREEDEARKLGEFRATHGGWSPNPNGFTHGLQASYTPSSVPTPVKQLPVNRPEYLVPEYTPEQMGEVLGGAPAQTLPDPVGAAAVQQLAPAAQAPVTPQAMPRPGTQQSSASEKTKDNKTANAAFRRFMTTFGGQRGER